MGNPLTSAQFVRLLDERLRIVREGIYKDLSPMIPVLYNVMGSDSAWDEAYSVGAVPDVPEMTGKIPYLPVAPGFHTRIEPKEYAAGIQVERKFLDDKKYGVLDDRAGGLISSAHRTQEKLGARAFVNAFSVNFDFMQSEENIALCGSHLTKSGTSTASGFSNSGSSVLSKTAVAATRILMRQFRNDISERVEISDDLALIVPDALADTASEIVGTEKGLYSAEHTVNMQYQRYKVIPYLRLDDFNATNWYMVDMKAMKRDLLWINRVMPEIHRTIDFETFLVKVAVYFRCAYGFVDWHWIYGHKVS